MIDKPAGPTSHDVVARIRRRLGTRAVGHTGTLDPFATGLLVLLVGRATRLARFVEQQAKTYFATARLGVRTSTDDLTGSVVELPPGDPGNSEPPGREAVAAALAALVGPQRQRPPVFSAKRVGGQRSHAMARRGRAVELEPAPVVVHALEMTAFRYPEVSFRTTVSAGTYVRALARDLGDRLGIGAHLVALRREAIGDLHVEQAVAPDQVSPEALLPALAVLLHLRRVDVTEEEAAALGHGRPVPRQADVAGQDPVTAVAPGDRLVAVARWRNHALHPDVVLEARG